MQYAIAAIERNSFGDLLIGSELTDVRDVIGDGMIDMPSELALDMYLEAVLDNGGSWVSYDTVRNVTVHNVPAGRRVLYLVLDGHVEITEVVLSR